MATKLELIRKLPKYIALAHGGYNDNPSTFVVPDDTVYIFLSKASRYLMDDVITPQFYDFFGRADKNYTAINSPNMPNVVKGWDARTYGPGQMISDITLQFSDPKWPGMGVHPLPIRQDQFKTTPGLFNGQIGPLSSLKMKGVIFIVACRKVGQQAQWFTNQKLNYVFPPNSTHARLLEQNKISKSLRKRRESSSSNNSSNMNTNKNNFNANNGSFNVMMQLMNKTRGIRSAIQEGNNSQLVRNAYRNFVTTMKSMNKPIMAYPTFKRRLLRYSLE